MNILATNFGSKTTATCGTLKGKYDYPEHIHQFAEIVFCINGSMTLTVDEKTETMNAGDMAVISPFRTHKFYTPEYVERWICCFSDDFMPKFVTQNEFLAKAKNVVFHPDEHLTEFLKNVLPDNKERAVPLSFEECRTINLIVTAVYENYLKKADLIFEQKSKTLPRILMYIKENFKSDVTLSSIGAALGYSPKYVSNCISQIKNFNLPLILNSFRINEGAAYKYPQKNHRHWYRVRI